MKNHWFKHGLAMLIAGAVLLQSTPTQAADSEAARPGKAATGSARATPYRGKIASIDHDARTLTLAGKTQHRTLIVTPQTRIQRHGQSAALQDAKVGDEVGGQYRSTPDGRLEAVSIRIGPKPEGSGKRRAGADEPK